MLFKDAPDLLGEFKDFLPEALGFGATPGGPTGISSQPNLGANSNFGQPDVITSDKVKKQIAPVRRKKRPAEKEATPVPSARGGTSRVRSLLLCIICFTYP
jgi:paired amphipathic helix protein Sin3a